MRTFVHRAALLVAVAVLRPATVRAQVVIFADPTFKLSNYNESSIFQSGTGSGFTFGQCTTCGNTGNALQLLYGFPNGGAVDIGFVNNTFSYDPLTQGAIRYISASVDKNITLDGVPPGGTITNTFRPLILQDFTYYLGAIAGPTLFPPGSTGYLSLGNPALTASSFVQYDFNTGTFGSGNPDFSGDPMQFGLASLIGVTPTGDNLTEIDFDNLNIAVSTVPEPSSLASLGLGLLGMAFTRRRRR